MKETFRKSMGWFHTWTGLVVGWLLFFIFLTGTLGYFEKEISRWMKPELPMAPTEFTNQELSQIALEHLKKVAPDSRNWNIHLPDSRNDSLYVRWYKSTDSNQTSLSHRRSTRPIVEVLNPNTKEVVTPRQTGGGAVLYRMHYNLHYVDARSTGRYIVGIAAMFMLIALLTGIVIHKNIFKDFFTFRQGKNYRSWLDGHMITGVLALPFHVMITYSGLAFFLFFYTPFIPLVNYNGKMMHYIQEAFPSERPIKLTHLATPLTPISSIVSKSEAYFGGPINTITIVNQGDSSSIVRVTRENTTLLSGDRVDKLYFSGISGDIIDSLSPKQPEASKVRSVLTGLHRGDFANTFGRWLYFLSGVLGTVMIATGLIMWVKKRELKQKDKFGFKLVNNLNIASIAGLPVAIASYFWANRLIPLDVPQRGNVEVDTMFITWLAMLLFAFALNSKKSWYIQFFLAGILYLLLPISNFFLTDRHLVATMTHGDWKLVWVDLTFFITGAIFCLIGYTVRRKTQL